MNSSLTWWQQESGSFLNDTLVFVNESRWRDRAVDRCGDLSKALNKVWNVYFSHRRQHNQLNDTEKEKGRSDSQSLRELLLNGLGDDGAIQLCRAACVRRLAEFTPQILNHDTLLRHRYDPSKITEDLRVEASDEHRQLQRAFQRCSDAPDDSSLREALLKKLAQLIYVVRSNIFHSEKTPRGPDVDKAQRDESVSKIVADVIEQIFDIIFDVPSQRLAFYGSRTPGDPSATALAESNGRWVDAEVDGQIVDFDGGQLFRWTLPGDRIPVRILCSADLSHYNQNDLAKGCRRILVPCHVADQISVCNIYAADWH
jgi:hypothetical protein